MTPSNDHIDQVYRDDYFKGGAAGYMDYLSEANILTSHGRRYGLILSKYTPPGLLLDVGTAAGYILKGLQESGWRGIGLEPNLSMVEYGRTHLDLQIECGSLEQFSTNQKFDVVVMIQVISHFYDIRQALQKAANITNPGGFWLIEMWDRESWVARILGKYWHEFSPPSVLHWFSPAGLKHLIAQFGFYEIARGRPKKFINSAHAKSLLAYKLQNSPLDWLKRGLAIVPDHLVFSYPTFDLYWFLFQNNPN
jgi:SAM-dependent methyltransferase